MIKRYPHTAQIISKNETGNDRGVKTFSDVTIDLKGRFEPASQRGTLNYSAKFYCKKINTTQFTLDGSKFLYEGKEFAISQLHNYQTRCEIWLD